MPRLSPLAPILEDCGRWETIIFNYLIAHIHFFYFPRWGVSVWVFAVSWKILNNLVSLRVEKCLSYPLCCFGQQSNNQPSRMPPEHIRSKPIVCDHIWYVCAHQLWLRFQRKVCLESWLTGSLSPSQSLSSSIQCWPLSIRVHTNIRNRISEIGSMASRSPLHTWNMHLIRHFRIAIYFLGKKYGFRFRYEREN